MSFCMFVLQKKRWCRVYY